MGRVWPRHGHHGRPLNSVIMQQGEPHGSELAAVASLILLALPGVTFAQKTYTPAQLHSMVDSGRYPSQGSARSTSQAMDYSECILKLESVVGAVRPNYPARRIVSTNLMRVEKVWTNDAAVTVSCSAPDRKMVMTSAPYN
jgi:hypothetical protein